MEKLRLLGSCGKGLGTAWLRWPLEVTPGAWQEQGHPAEAQRDLILPASAPRLLTYPLDLSAASKSWPGPTSCPLRQKKCRDNQLSPSIIPSQGPCSMRLRALGGRRRMPLSE